MRRWLVLPLALALLASACGTRQSHEAVVAAAGADRGPSSGADPGAGSGSGTSGNGVVDGVTGDQLGGVSAGAAGASGAASSGASALARSRSSSGGSQGSSGGSGASTATGPKSPVKLASVGTLSGPAGDTLKGIVQALQAWQRYVNDKGGVNGHQVQLTIVDDGTDPARHRAQIQQQVEQEKVLAFLNNIEPLTGQGSVQYITSKRIPVIGSETGGKWFYTSPMYFPQASSGDNLIYVAIASSAPRALARGKHKLGTLVCTEAQICTDADRLWTQYGAQLGMTPVYRGKTSLAQPDFTAECLSARNAGVELLQISLDTNSVGRVAASCARQGYHPIISFGASIVADRLAEDSNLAGTLGSSNVFAYFQGDTPATAEFQRVMKKYLPNVRLGVSQATGWVSGKLFEKAAANLPEPPTTAAILDGLWSIKNDTLGGITQPLTYVRDKNTAEGACWFDLEIRSRQWVSPDNYAVHCRNRPGT